MSIQGVCLNVNAESAVEPVSDEVIVLSADSVNGITLCEGEQIKLDFQMDEAFDSNKYVTCYSNNNDTAYVSYSGKLTGYRAGECTINAYVKDIYSNYFKQFEINVTVKKNSDISSEKLDEIDRLNSLSIMEDFRRRKMELIGAADENAPRLTLEKMQEFIESSKNHLELLKKVMDYTEYPDVISDGGATSYCFWLDSKGNEVITIGYEQDFAAYTKISDDGTVIGCQMLYPNKTEFTENGKTKDYIYTLYNQIKAEEKASVTLNFIDSESGKAFTDTDGEFQLLSASDDKVIKSWKSSENSNIIINELSKDGIYDIIFIDEYSGDSDDDYKYEINGDNRKYRFSFGSLNELSLNIEMKKRYRNSPVLLGDINDDNAFNIADVVSLQKWLIGNSEGQVTNWQCADLNNDLKLDVFDLILMKHSLTEKQK